jgi:hypothetical protein
MTFCFLRFPAFFVAVLALVSWAHAAPDPITVLNRALYVSPTGSNKNDGLSPERAFLTGQAAANISEPGDVIYFAEGEYSHDKAGALLTIRRSGEPGKPITYAPAPGAKVVFRSKGSWDMIKVTGARHIVIRGFRVIGSAGDVTLEEATAEMSNLKNPRTCGNGIGITADSEKNPSAHVTVSDCEVSDFPGGGIFTNHSDYITFERNVVYRNAFWSPYGNSGISVYQPTDIDDYTGYKIIIRDNVCFENYQNIPFFFSNRKDPSKRRVTDGNGIIIDDYLNSQDWGRGSGKPYGGRTLVANNIVFANGGSGIHSYKSTNVDIVHNYAADNNRHPALDDGQIFANTSKNARILNNVVIAPPGKPVNSSTKNENILHDHNLYATLDGSAPTFAGEKAGNLVGVAPGLVLSGWAEGKRTFTIAADSPLRAAGLPLADAPVDFFGKPRDAARPDIGPFVLNAH